VYYHLGDEVVVNGHDGDYLNRPLAQLIDVSDYPFVAVKLLDTGETRRTVIGCLSPHGFNPFKAGDRVGVYNPGAGNEQQGHAKVDHVVGQSVWVVYGHMAGTWEEHASRVYCLGVDE
jgi:hypothetical protein